MRAYFYKQPNAERLIWIFAGWGMDQALFLNRPLPGLSAAEQMNASLVILYDYIPGSIQWVEHAQIGEIPSIPPMGWEQLIQSKEILAHHQHVLWAWSMGVWAAEQYPLPPLEMALAVNGTAKPVHDDWGIPSAVFEGTLEGLSLKTLEKFRKRMCGRPELLYDFKLREPQRSLDDLKAELAYIGSSAQVENPYPKPWDRAFLSTEDAIFPIHHMEQYWQFREVPCQLRPGAHYPYTV